MSKMILCKKGCEFNLDELKVEWILLFEDNLILIKLSKNTYLISYKVEEVATKSNTSTTS